MKDDTSRRRVALAGFYGALADSSDPARRVGWESAPAQRLRLETLASIAEPLTEIGSVLDAGCGEGALYDVLARRGFAGRYRGEDLREVPIARARARVSSAEWVVADAFSGGSDTDIVFCSGALNTDSGAVDHQAEVEATLGVLFARARIGLVFDIAVRDRHHPGVLLAAVDLAVLHGFCRRLTPIVSVHEDTVSGEAVFALWRSRARGFLRRSGDPVLAAENLLLAGEAAAALDALGPQRSARALRIRGQALVALGRYPEALASLTEAAQSGDPVEAPKAALAQAPLLWRMGRKAEAEALLVRLARSDDEARAHLFELQLARKLVEEARATALAVTDPWMRRELMRILEETSRR